jgi:hypothetical protein
MVELKLFCWVLERSTSAFPVNMQEDETVGDLKDEIKRKNPNMFHGIDAAQLDLWKVSDCTDERDMVLTTHVFKVSIADNKNLAKSVGEVELNEDDSLLATMKLSDVFKDYPAKEGHIHIIVRSPPVSGESVACSIVCGLTITRNFRRWTPVKET